MKKSKLLSTILILLSVFIISLTSTGAYSYFTFGEQIYGQKVENPSSNINKLKINYKEGLVSGNITFSLTKYIYNPPRIRLLSKNNTPILDELNNEVIIEAIKVNEDGEYICYVDNNLYKAFKFQVLGYSSEIKLITGNEIESENNSFKRTLKVNYYDKIAANEMIVESSLLGKGGASDETLSQSLPKIHSDIDGRWRSVQFNYETLSVIGEEITYSINVNGKSYSLATTEENEEVWIKYTKLYKSKPPENNKLTLIVRNSALNNVPISKNPKFMFGSFYNQGIGSSVGANEPKEIKPYKNSVYQWQLDTTYEQNPSITKFWVKFEANDGAGNFEQVSEIPIPTIENRYTSKSGVTAECDDEGNIVIYLN